MLMEMPEKQELFLRKTKFSTIALFGNYMSSMSSGKELEGIDVAQIDCLMWNLITSPGTLIGFDRVFEDCEGECTSAPENFTIDFMYRILLRFSFCFAEKLEKATFEIGYRLTVNRTTIMQL